MDNRKVAISVGSIVMLALFAFLVTCTVFFFQERGKQDEAYQNGFTDGTAELDSTKATLEEYRTKLTEANAEIVELNADIAELTSSATSLQQQITNLTTQKSELETQVNNLNAIKISNETTISNLQNQTSELQSQVNTLTDSNNEKLSLISQKDTQISELQTVIEQLQVNNSLNTETITALQSQIVTLNSEIAELQTQVNEQSVVISQKNTQITELNSQIASLQVVNESNATMISNLNAHIETLNSQIESLTAQVNSNSSVVSALNAQIAKLQTSIAYYENFIANLETGEQVVITIEFNGSVYNIQVIQSGSTVSVADPTNTDYVIFNYWQDEDGTQVDLSSKTFTESTTITANVTYRYDVNFVFDDNNNYNTQIVTSGAYATAPTSPTKTGYTFVGWSLNGTDVVDVGETAITSNTTFIAVFEINSYQVTFMSDSETVDTQEVNYNSYAVTPVSPTKTGYTFAGWSLNGTTSVDVSETAITEATTFIALWTINSYDVNFVVDDNNNYDTQEVNYNTYATAPTNPTKTGYTFVGWSLNGTDVVTVEQTTITSNTTFIAVFEINSYDVTFISDSETVDTQKVNYNLYAVAPVSPTKTGYTFAGWSLNGTTSVNVSETVITEATTFIALWTINSYDVNFVVDDNNNYDTQEVNYNTYATAPTSPIKTGYIFKGWSLNGTDVVDVEQTAITEDVIFVSIFSEPIFEEKMWNGLSSISGSTIWTDNNNIYYSNETEQYILDIETSTWIEKTWNGLSSFDGSNIWMDGSNIYYSYFNSFSSINQQYVLNQETSTWEVKTWNGFSSLIGRYVWTDGTSIYYSSGTNQYVLNQETSTWEIKTWNGLTDFSGGAIWTDNNNIYYSNGTEQYILDIKTSTWQQKTWNGLSSFGGSSIWTDGVNIYYSFSLFSTESQYILDIETSTWMEKTWENLTSFNATGIWTDGVNIYYSSGSNQYVLNT